MDDRRLAQAALAKRAKGQKPSREEVAALRRVERARDEQLRAEHYATVPKKWWVENSGRQYKTLNENAARYGLPVGGRTIDLAEVVRWLHDHLSHWGPKLLEPDATPSNLDAIREEDLKTKRLKNEVLAGGLIPVDEIRRGMKGFAGHIRKAGEILRRRDQLTGDEAAEILNNAMDDAKRDWTDSLPTSDADPLTE